MNGFGTTQKLVRRIRRDSLMGTLKGVWCALRANSLGIYRLEELSPPVKGEMPAPQGDLTVLNRLRASLPPLPDQFYYDRERGFARCFFFAVGDKPVAILWAVRRGSRIIELTDGSVELCGLYVLPECRRRNLAQSLVWHACRQFQRESGPDLYAVIERRNVASQKTFEGLGFRKIAELRRPVLFGPRYVTRAGNVESWWAFVFRCLGLMRHEVAADVR